MADSEKTITIDGKEYLLDNLSKAARAQLANVRITDQEITRLERQLAITRTARLSYARSLVEELPET